MNTCEICLCDSDNLPMSTLESAHEVQATQIVTSEIINYYPNDANLPFHFSYIDDGKFVQFKAIFTKTGTVSASCIPLLSKEYRALVDHGISLIINLVMKPILAKNCERLPKSIRSGESVLNLILKEDNLFVIIAI